MRENVTNIPNDNSFLEELDKTIELFINKENNENLIGAENTILQYLLLISKIAKKQESLKGKQENYISIQRVLSDDPELFMCDKVSELSYYFAYIYKLPE